MRSMIQELIGTVLLIGTLFIALKSTLKKGAELYKYAIKISKSIKTVPQRQQNISSEPIKRSIWVTTVTSPWFFALFISYQVAMLILYVSDPKPLTRVDVLQISMSSALLATMLILALITFLLGQIWQIIRIVISMIPKS